MSPLDSALSVPALARKSRNWKADFGIPAASRALSNRPRNIDAVIGVPSSATMSRVARTLCPVFLALIRSINFASSPAISILRFAFVFA
ncbi:hypothetical protein D3C76_1652140 [compost metagenome]